MTGSKVLEFIRVLELRVRGVGTNTVQACISITIVLLESLCNSGLGQLKKTAE